MDSSFLLEGRKFLHDAFNHGSAIGILHERHSGSLMIGLFLLLITGLSQAVAQNPPRPSPTEPPVELMQPTGQAAPPITVTLQDALERARKLDPTLLSAITDTKVAREDRIQAKVALFPTANYTMEYLGTQGNGGRISDGRFVTNDGVHVYRVWGVFHQDLSGSTVLRVGYKRATAAEALAGAKVEIARRGLTVTVTKNYYSLAVSQRKYATAQQSVQQAQRFLDITQAAERLGQVAHSDVVKAQIQYEQQRQAFEEARLTMENDRLNLAVLLFPALNENFSIVDDLESAQTLPPFADLQAMAERENPDLRVAMESLRAATVDVSAARAAFLPTVTVDTDYGIEANCFALHCTRAAFPEVGVVPNLGYFVTAHLSVPVWDWGTLRSKLRQTQFKREQAGVELSRAQRQLLSNLYAFYNEASVARTAIETLRRTADLAAESLRLINLRYQAGESTALEVVDAQNTLTQARNAVDDAQARYRNALANLQTLTGSF